MPWQERTVIDAKMQFIEAATGGCMWDGRKLSFTALCAVFGIAPKTGYKYLHRYLTEGAEGLVERSRAPHHPRRITREIINRVLEAHTAHEDMGPVKLRQWLDRRYPDTEWPAASTIATYLRQAGRTAAPTPPAIRVVDGTLTAPDTVNDVWGADFKGWCRTSDGTRCEPWTLTDLTSRYLLGCVGLETISTTAVWALFESAFRSYGLPAVIRTDNGTPFVTSERLGVSRLTIWWLKLGIRHERIRAGCPQQNGRHERFHRTLKAGTMCPPAATLLEQQLVFDRFAEYYNYERPHAALHGESPASVYCRSLRQYTPAAADFTFTYPSDWQVRRVGTKGCVKWAGRHHFVSETLIGESIGYRQLTSRYWGVYVGALALAVWEPTRRRYLPKRQAAEVLHLAEFGQVQDLGQEQETQTVTDVLE